MKIINDSKKYFCLFACCILVNGASRSSIVDTQRKSLHFIPNSLYFILTRYKNKTIEWIRNYFQDDNILDSYYDFLIRNELGFYADSLKKFPSIDLSYSIPNTVTNAIIEVSDHSDYNMDKAMNELSELGCETLEIRFLSVISWQRLSNILNKTNISNFRSIIIGLPYIQEYSLENIQTNLLYKYAKITRLHVYACDFYQVFNTDWNEPLVIFSQQKSLSSEHCGHVNPDYFAPCLEMICESKLYNSCLNKKVCISEDGGIKNCPAFSKSFGHIDKSTLLNITNEEEFRKMWYIKKDDIKVCQDCEMRYVCHDCRAHVIDPNDLYSKPINCKYNPYKGVWE